MTEHRSPGDDLKTVFAGLVFLWICFVIQGVMANIFGIYLIPLLGLMPGEPRGLIGILTAPLLHSGWDHLIGNSIALAILGYMARRTAPEGSGLAILLAMICGGVLAWTTGLANHPHIGASGVAFGLMGFLLVNGLVRGGCAALLTTALVGCLFGGALLTVLKTTSADGIPLSWQMHAGGLAGGVIGAWVTRKRRAD